MKKGWEHINEIRGGDDTKETMLEGSLVSIFEGYIPRSSAQDRQKKPNKEDV